MNSEFITAYLKIITESRKDDYTQQLENKGVENASEMAEYLFQYNNHKKEKAALYWLLKGTIKLPEDQYKVDKAFNLIEKQHLDFQKFDNPMSVINRDDESTKRINAQDESFNPDKEPTFSNKKELGDGVVVYQVEDCKEGQLAVRKAIDANWGYDKNPWCLAARDNKNDTKLATAWKYWSETYTAYPKRIAFKNGKLLAFCANDSKEIAWWDKNDKSTVEIPETNTEDDLKFVKKYIRNFDIYLASNPNTLPKVLIKLADDKNWEVRANVAENKNCPIKLLEKLSNDKDESVRVDVANNQNTPVEILLKLADDEYWNVRCLVAENKNTPPEILEKLSDDENWEVRACVANNKNIPTKLLIKLSDDEDESVRMNVAENKNTPPEILEKLANDKNKYVKEKVAENKNTPAEILLKLANEPFNSIKAEVAQNQNTPTEALIKLADDENWVARRFVAENKNTPAEILLKLADDEDENVRYHLAKNENTPKEALLKLVKDENKDVRNAAKYNLENRK